MKNKITVYLSVLLVLNIIIMVTLFFRALKVADYTLKIDSDNQEEILSLLSEAKIKVDDEKNLEKIDLKQGKGDVYLFCYYQKEDDVEEHIADDHDEISKYIRKNGKRVGYVQENIVYMLWRTIPVIIILIILNEIYCAWQNRKDTSNR